MPLLTNKITVFMGQTGVGKSTLLNRIAPELKLETGEISDSLGRGRHTTRAVSLYDVHGGKIADTPGFSSLDYEVDNAEDLSEAFRKSVKLVMAVNSVLVPIPMSLLVLLRMRLKMAKFGKSVMIITFNF